MGKEKKDRRTTPEICPVCGEEVPRKALACPECGADDKSGWREEAHTYDAVDLPNDDFNYDEFVRREFARVPGPARVKVIWWITGIFLLVVIVAFYSCGPLIR